MPFLVLKLSVELMWNRNVNNAYMSTFLCLVLVWYVWYGVVCEAWENQDIWPMDILHIFVNKQKNEPKNKNTHHPHFFNFNPKQNNTQCLMYV